jgi:protein-tyrosine phosphatase
VVHRAVEAISEGKLVAFPTETVYGIAANGLDEAAVQRLMQIKGRGPDKPLALAIRGIDQAVDYCPDMSAVGRRLSQRCWPGPLTLVFPANHPDGLVQQLPAGVHRAVSPNGMVGLRVPDHRFVLSTLRLLLGPLALTSANRGGQADAVSADEVLDALGDDIDLVLSEGRSKYARPSSVVRIDGNQVRILREGVLTEFALRRSASLVVLVVCTGNTCRSPMAQKLLQKQLADKLGCDVSQVDSCGVLVISAGVAAAVGGPASAQAVTAMQQRGLDLSQHESQPVSDVLVRLADHILTMTHGHREMVLSRWPEAARKTELLRCDGGDVADPIGGSVDEYARCADQIDAHLQQWAQRLDFNSIPVFT